MKRSHKIAISGCGVFAIGNVISYVQTGITIITVLQMVSQ